MPAGHAVRWILSLLAGAPLCLLLPYTVAHFPVPGIVPSMAHAAVVKPVSMLVDNFLTFIGEITLITLDALKRLFTSRLEMAEIVNQMAFIGVASVPIVVLTNLSSGAVLSLYTTHFLVDYGGQAFVGGTVGLAVTREIGPVLAGIMVASRCGSAMAAQIGTMAVTEQIDALRMLSVHPTNYLVLPRIIAGIFMVPILALMGVFAAGFGGLLVAKDNGVSSAQFLDSMRTYVTTWDVAGGFLKGPFFGLIVAVVACQQGLRTTNGAVGVGKATTNTVVISMVLIYVVNFFLAQVFFQH